MTSKNFNAFLVALTLVTLNVSASELLSNDLAGYWSFEGDLIKTSATHLIGAHDDVEEGTLALTIDLNLPLGKRSIWMGRMRTSSDFQGPEDNFKDTFDGNIYTKGSINTFPKILDCDIILFFHKETIVCSAKKEPKTKKLKN